MFKPDSVADTLHRISERKNESSFAQSVFDALSKASPMSLEVIFRTHLLGQKMSLRDAMQMEFKLCYSYMHDLENDFYEGIRAVVIDKDNKPTWRHNKVQQITEKEIDEYFNPKDLQNKPMPLDI